MFLFWVKSKPVVAYKKGAYKKHGTLFWSFLDMKNLTFPYEFISGGWGGVLYVLYALFYSRNKRPSVYWPFELSSVSKFYVVSPKIFSRSKKPQKSSSDVKDLNILRTENNFSSKWKNS